MAECDHVWMYVEDVDDRRVLLRCHRCKVDEVHYGYPHPGREVHALLQAQLQEVDAALYGFTATKDGERVDPRDIRADAE